METGSVAEMSQPTSQEDKKTGGPTPRRSPFPIYILPALSGLLLYLCFYPLGCGFLGWLALVPLLGLVRMDARPRTIYFASYLGGCLFYFLVLYWMTVADWRMFFTWGMLATYCALYFPMAVLLLRRLERATSWPLTITVPLVWTGLEFVRSFLLTGFAWYYLGHTQHHYLAAIQVADLGGVYMISFVMAAANGWLAEILLRIPELRKSRWLAPASPIPRRRFGLAVLTLVSAMFIYGGWRLSQDKFELGPSVALLQGNIDQRILIEASSGADKGDNLKYLTDYYSEMSAIAATVFVPAPDLIIWPETSFPYAWLELPGDLNKVPAETRNNAFNVQNFVRRLVAETKTNHLIGLNSVVFDDKKKTQYNSALLMTEGGAVAGRYDKIHRVPFGEYVPLRDWLPFMNYFAPYDFDYSISQGEKQTRFPLGKYHFGVLICNEDTDPALARHLATKDGKDPAVDFLVNISNDGWFDGSSEHAEHLAISRFRAVETRRALTRAVNMGISAVIDGNGRVLQPTERPAFGDGKIWAVPESQRNTNGLPEEKWRDFTKVHGILAARIPIDERVSLYALTGDWLPVGCWLILGGVWGWRKCRRFALSAR